MSKIKTNFDPEASSLGGIKISSGIKLKEAKSLIIKEITKNVAPQFFGFTDKKEDKIKFKVDPEKTVYFSLPVFSYGIGLILCDPTTTGSEQINNSKNAFGFHGDLYKNDYLSYKNDPIQKVRKFYNEKKENSKAGKLFFSQLGKVDTDLPTNTLKQDHRLWIFSSSDYLIWKIWSVQEQRTSGVGMVWFNSTPEDGHYTRNQVPSIAARSFKNWPADKAIAPAHKMKNRSMLLNVDEEMRMVPNRGDTNGREIIQNQVAFTPNKPLPAFWGKIPGIKVVREESVAVWNIMKLNGDNWVCFHKDSGRGYLTRYENSK